MNSPSCRTGAALRPGAGREDRRALAGPAAGGAVRAIRSSSRWPARRLPVHFAKLKGGPNHGREVAVRCCAGHAAGDRQRPALMRDVATARAALGRRQQAPQAARVVAEFDKYLHDELDLMIEAANASQLRHNFSQTNLLLVPGCSGTGAAAVFVMERMHGIPISRTEALRAAGVDMHKLAEGGRRDLLHPVFRDGFFHADMHRAISSSRSSRRPSAAISPSTSASSARSPNSTRTTAQNFIAFFRRDYHRVALHVESGWVPPETRVGGARECRARLLRAVFRQAAQGNLAGHGADAPVPDLAPLQCGDPAAAGAAAEDPAQYRRAGAPARSRPRPVDRQALPRTLDARTGGLEGGVGRIQIEAPGPDAARLPRTVHQFTGGARSPARPGRRSCWRRCCRNSAVPTGWSVWPCCCSAASWPAWC